MWRREAFDFVPGRDAFINTKAGNKKLPAFV
jgi:hypothetical protein